MSTPPTVLVVDDSITIRMDLAGGLEQAGFHVALAATAAACRAAVVKDRPDLVLLDVMLPDGDGLELLRELRAAPATAKLPVMMLSSEAEVRDRLAGLAYGADDYVGKPYELSYVVARARELCHAPAPSAAGGATVLVIDDSPTFRAALADALGRAGFTVLQAASGEEGLALAALRRPDAAIVDWQLPGINGPTVVRRLRMDPILRRLPSMVLTAGQGQGEEAEALESGADAYALKSDDVELVVARLGALLRSSSHTAEPAEAPRAQRILLVDESEDERVGLAAALAVDGCDLVRAGSVDEALAFLAAQRVDGVLLDLPEAGPLCRRIKEHEGWREIPLVVLADGDDPAKMIATLDAGADDYVVKVRGFEAVQGRLRALLRRRRFEHEARQAEEQRLARALAEATAAAKSEFFAAMSHELRTPLNAILGVADLLAETQLTPIQAGYVRMFRQAGQNLRALVNDVLDLSKAEAGQMKLEEVPFDLGELLANTLEPHTLQAHAKGVALTTTYVEGTTGHVLGDPVRLGQIVNNLAGNALKFTSQGSILVTVSREADDPQLLHLAFRDTGIGIPADKLETIFERYSQADASTTRKYGGTGLGLSITRHLAELMGGRVWVESQVGTGSTFHVTLRLPAVAPPAAAPAPAPAAIEDPRHLRVLLADDSEDNQLIFKAFMAKTGYQVEAVGDGATALARVLANRYDVVIMDVQMPVMDGLAATRAIRQWEADHGLAPTPIVAMTAFATGDAAAECTAAGATAHVSKPVRRAVFLAALRDNARVLAEERTAKVVASLQRLVPRYLENVRLDVTALEAALAAGNLKEINTLGHKMCGSAGTLGFEPIGAIAARLMDLEDLAPVPTLLADLRAYLERVEVEVVEDTDD